MSDLDDDEDDGSEEEEDASIAEGALEEGEEGRHGHGAQSLLRLERGPDRFAPIVNTNTQCLFLIREVFKIQHKHNPNAENVFFSFGISLC